MSEFKMTFGPEWLRALADGDGNSESQTKPVTTKRFKLADFRYGREEMLALFMDNIKVPKELKDFGDVILQETQSQPLSFIPMTEEEERCQVAGVNSQVFFRASGRGVPIRGRGAMRGNRGRGRGEGQPGYYRTLSNEETGFSNPREQYARRPWAEGARGGSSDRGTGRGDPPGVRGGFDPRPRIPSDRAGSTEREPWRSTSQEEDDGGGWRISGQRSWRKGSADASRNWRTDISKDEGGDPAARRSWNRSNSNSGLPEWCDDDIDQDVGTFDSSGQFKSFKSTEEYDKDDDGTDVFEDAEGKNEESENKSQNAKQKNDTGSRSDIMQKLEKINDNRILNGVNRASPRELRRESPSSVNGITSAVSDKDVTKGQSLDKAIKEIVMEHDRPPNSSKQQKTISGLVSVSDLEKEYSSVHVSESMTVNKTVSEKINDLTIDDVRSVAHDMRKILAESHARPQPRGHEDEVDNHKIEADIKNLIDKLDDEIDNISPTNQMASANQDVNDCNVVDPSILFAKKAEPGVLIKGMQDWIYRDPQGEIQGPFSSEEMLQWFKAGYFTMGLLVRRVCDEIFLPLGDIIKLWNRVPFQPGREPPAITSQVYAAQLARRQQEEYQRIAQQRKMQQQQQQQNEQRELRILQQMKEQQQLSSSKDMKQRPHNLNFPQEVSIWGESPAASPNLASTPWTPSSSEPEPLAWNHAKPSTGKTEDLRNLEKNMEKTEKIKSPNTTQDSSKDDKILKKESSEQKASIEGELKKANEIKSYIVTEEIPTSKNDDESDSSSGDKNKSGQAAKKAKEKKKKQEGDKKKKEEREKQQKREEETRKAQEAMERQHQEKLALQKKKEEEERQHQLKLEMHQRQLLQQQQQQIMQQQQQMKQHQMLLQQQKRQEIMQQEQRRQNVNDTPSWNVPISSNAPSLAEIQRMEEERQMIIHEKMKQIQAHEQQLQQQQRASSGWSEKGGPPVASLRQIQEEEARILAMQRSHQHHHSQQQQQRVSHVQNSSVWTSKSTANPMGYAPYGNQSNALFWDDVMTRAPSLETSAHFHKTNPKSRVVSDSAFPTLNVSSKQSKQSKEEEVVHRLFQQTNPCDDFINWVNKNMPGIAKYVDVPTFVGFLQDIDSPYEVNEYIRSYFGDSRDAEKFAKEFLEWNRKNPKQQSPQYPVTSGIGNTLSGSDLTSPDADDPTGRKKKQKKRMQKVSPNLLGFSCNPDPDLVNRGEIQSAMDAWSNK